MRNFVFFLAKKHLRHRRLQSLLTILGVAVGVMVLITALSLTNGFISELLRSTLSATPHVTLRGFGGDGAPELPFDESVLAEIQATPGVEAASPFVLTQALVARRADARIGVSARSGFAQVYGIYPELQRQVLDLDVLDATVEALEDGGIVLGGSLARSLGVTRGDEVLIVDINQQRRFYRVAGTFSVGNELIDSVTAFVAASDLQAFLGAEGLINGYHVRTHDPEEAGVIATALAQRLDLFPTTWQALFGTLINQLQLQKALISAVVFLIVLVAAMGIANILILTVSEKTEEIAVLRAMGASERQILSVFTLEGFMLGGLGTALGTALGLGLSLYFKFQPYPLPGDLYFISQLPVDLQAFDFLWVSGLSLATSVIAGLIPARRASHLQPARILR